MRRAEACRTVSGVPSSTRQLLVYRFGPESRFEGQLVGALERIESGGAMRVLDVLFVARDIYDMELVAVSMQGRGAAGIIGRLLDFRLEAREREAMTRRALDGPVGETVQTLAADLEPRSAVAALLVEHMWAGALEDAIARTGGARVMSEFVEADGLHDLSPKLGATAKQPDQLT
jgi:hypothetical protein